MLIILVQFGYFNKKKKCRNTCLYIIYNYHLSEIVSLAIEKLFIHILKKAISKIVSV